jgi:hypothetical protein
MLVVSKLRLFKWISIIRNVHMRNVGCTDKFIMESVIIQTVIKVSVTAP